jgi:hypothetical protein
VGSRGSGAWLTLNLNSTAPQLCDLQLLLNCSESQISQVQNGEDLVNNTVPEILSVVIGSSHFSARWPGSNPALLPRLCLLICIMGLSIVPTS